jgi:hypothetical protein
VQRSLDLVVLLGLVLYTWTSAIHRLDLELQLGLLWSSWVDLGLDRRRYLDSIRRICYGRTMQ